MCDCATATTTAITPRIALTQVFMAIADFEHAAGYDDIPRDYDPLAEAYRVLWDLVDKYDPIEPVQTAIVWDTGDLSYYE